MCTILDKRKIERGFTLIELLVVISIIGLISSIALANFQDAREKAKQAAGKQFDATVNHTVGAYAAGSWSFESRLGLDPEDFEYYEVKDSSGNELNGIIEGAQTVEEAGINGPSIYFDGDDYIWGKNFPTIQNHANITVSAWVKPTNVVSNNTIFSLQGSGFNPCDGGFRVGILGGKGFVNGSETTSYSLINNVWQNIVFVYRSDGVNDSVDTYVNGNKISSVDGVGVSACEKGNWTIGATVNFESGDAISDAFIGEIDDVNVYREAFASEKIREIYADQNQFRKILASEIGK